MEDKNMDLYQNVGLRIRQARMEKGMSQQELSDKADVALPHLSNIELGKKIMRLDTFSRIIEALQVSADFILRSDVPSVNEIYQSEFKELLADCSPKELDTLYSIMKQIINALHSKQDNQN